MTTKTKTKRKRIKPIRRIGDDGASLKPFWKGPVEDGITFSLLSKFVVCRERFRLKVIEGLKEKEAYNLPLEFGSLWHEGEEAHAGGKDYKPVFQKYCRHLRREYRNAESEIHKTFQIAKYTFPLYINHWSKHPDERGRKPIFEEVAFRVPYKLPSGRIIVLRGKWDCVFRVKDFIWLQENKTKGRIDEEGIQKTIEQNLQTMLYQIALRQFFQTKIIKSVQDKKSMANLARQFGKDFSKLKIKGVIYNVIRRPLADNHAIKQRGGRLINKKDKEGKTVKGKDGKPKKVRVGAETEKQFYQRMAGDIKKDPNHYFKRWKVTLTEKDIAKFKMKTFDPILEQLLDWWEWMKLDGFKDPWRIPRNADLKTPPGPIPNVPGGGIHWQAPWGVYNNMFGGFRGDFFDLLTSGRKTNIIPAESLFPELAS